MYNKIVVIKVTVCTTGIALAVRARASNRDDDNTNDVNITTITTKCVIYSRLLVLL